jgi:hypothetical protein
MGADGVAAEFLVAKPPIESLYWPVVDNNVVHWGGEFYPNPAQLIQGGWGRRRSEAALPVGMYITCRGRPPRVRRTSSIWRPASTLANRPCSRKR